MENTQEGHSCKQRLAVQAGGNDGLALGGRDGEKSTYLRDILANQ